MSSTTHRSKEIARILLSLKAVSLSPKKPFTFASGIKSPIYCDNRLLISYPKERMLIRDAFLTAIQEHAKDVDVIAGTATAGIPHAAWIADKLQKPMIYIRSSAKQHGKENLIEGKMSQGQKVAVIEDLISTGGSSIAAVKNVKEAGGKVEYCFAIFTYQFPKAAKAFHDEHCKLITLSDFQTLVEEATLLQYITQEEKKMVLEWNAAPEEWGKKHGFC